MFGLGLPELGIIAVVALLIFGPKKIPEFGSAFGKTLRNFRDGMDNPDEDDLALDADDPNVVDGDVPRD